jgi:PHS family inorganic phosphate transporter-like MFS transporter
LLLGAIPAACVFFQRRKIAETPRFMHYIFKNKDNKLLSPLFTYFPPKSIFSRKWFTLLMGTSVAWFLFDIAFYGNGVSSIMIINHLFPDASLLEYTLLTSIIFLVFAFPGYILSVLFVDKIGRKFLQSLGFIIMGLCYSVMALIPSIEKHLLIFIALFGVSFFFINFGPNVTTFLIPSEIFPTKIRAQAHGISAAIGKIGAVAGVCLLPNILSSFHFSITMWFVAFISILGAMITQLLPEMRHKSLEITE